MNFLRYLIAWGCRATSQVDLRLGVPEHVRELVLRGFSATYSAQNKVNCEPNRTNIRLKAKIIASIYAPLFLALPLTIPIVAINNQAILANIEG